MQGIIVLWSGAIVDIPPGWHLCDGQAGTPDLRNRFIVGAGDTYAPDAVGGSGSHDHTASSVNDIHNHVATNALDQHVHTFEGDGHDHGVDGSGHFHPLEVGNQIENVYPDGAFYDHTEDVEITGDTTEEDAVGTTDADQHGHVITVQNDTHNHGITVNAKTVLPPYYALAYIMKM